MNRATAVGSFVYIGTKKICRVLDGTTNKPRPDVARDIAEALNKAERLEKENKILRSELDPLGQELANKRLAALEGEQ